MTLVEYPVKKIVMNCYSANTMTSDLQIIDFSIVDNDRFFCDCIHAEIINFSPDGRKLMALTEQMYNFLF